MSARAVGQLSLTETVGLVAIVAAAPCDAGRILIFANKIKAVAFVTSLLQVQAQE